MTRCAGRLAVALLASIAAVAAPHARAVAYLDLGERDLFAYRISDDGKTIVGSERVDGGADTLIRWTESGGVEHIGGMRSGGLPGISGDGSVIVGTVMNDYMQVAFWTGGTDWNVLENFPLIPPRAGWSGEAEAISHNGLNVAGYNVVPPLDLGWQRAFHWDPTWGWSELPLMRENSNSVATGISDDGHVIVGWNDDALGALRGVRWVRGKGEWLTSDDGERFGEAFACNPDCSIVVGDSVGDSSLTSVLAYRWTAEHAQYLYPFDGAPVPARYAATGLSADGNTIVGTYSYIENKLFFVRGFIWIADSFGGGAMTNFATWLADRGEHTLDDWDWIVPVGVSADGRWVVGWGYDATDQQRAFRIDLGGPDEIFAGTFD